MLKNLYVPVTINVPFRDVQVTHAMGTNTPWHHQRDSDFKMMSTISKNILKSRLIRPRDQLTSVPHTKQVFLIIQHVT